MPYYDYDCRACGTFELRRPLSEFALPAPCPKCGQESARKLSAPYVAGSATSSNTPGPCGYSPADFGPGGCGGGGCGHAH